MIQNITRGSSPEGALRYVHENESAERVAGSMCGRTPKQMAREWEAYRKRNPRVEQDVWHSSLSVHPDDELSDTECFDIANEYVDRMGFGDSPWVAYRHDDTDHTHIHIVASRVQFDGQAVDVWRDYTRGEQVCRELEDEYELTKAPPSQSRDRKAPTREEYELQKRTGEKSIKEDLGDRVENAAWASSTMREFADELEARDVAMKMHRRDDGEPYGVEYVRVSDGERMKGSDLGRAFGWGGLQKRAEIEYDNERGDARLERSNERAEAAIAGDRGPARGDRDGDTVRRERSGRGDTGDVEGDGRSQKHPGDEDSRTRRAVERARADGEEDLEAGRKDDAGRTEGRGGRRVIERRSREDSGGDQQGHSDHQQERFSDSGRSGRSGDRTERSGDVADGLRDADQRGEAGQSSPSEPKDAPSSGVRADEDAEKGIGSDDETLDMAETRRLRWKHARKHEREQDGKTFAGGELEEGELVERQSFEDDTETLVFEEIDGERFDFADVPPDEVRELEMGDTIEVTRIGDHVKVEEYEPQQGRGGRAR